jgi:Transposase IS66 family
VVPGILDRPSNHFFDLASAKSRNVLCSRRAAPGDGSPNISRTGCRIFFKRMARRLLPLRVRNIQWPRSSPAWCGHDRDRAPAPRSHRPRFRLRPQNELAQPQIDRLEFGGGVADPERQHRTDRPWGGTDPPAIAYSYATGRGAIHALKLLEGYRGIVQCDGYGLMASLGRPASGPAGRAANAKRIWQPAPRRPSSRSAGHP